jgi:uncharacterized integral membrane protein
MADHEPQPRRRSELHSWAFGVAIALLILFVALNSRQVKVNFIFATAKTPLVFALLLAALFGALLGWLWPRLRRRR